MGQEELQESLLSAALACLVVARTASVPWADQGSWVGLLVEILQWLLFGRYQYHLLLHLLALSGPRCWPAGTATAAADAAGSEHLVVATAVHVFLVQEGLGLIMAAPTGYSNENSINVVEAEG